MHSDSRTSASEQTSFSRRSSAVLSPTAQHTPIEAPSTIAALIVSLVALAVFWRTAYPSITWWDSSGYSLAAATLGIYSPPGSLLLTLVGWPIAHISGGGAAARALDIGASIIAASTVALVYLAAIRLTKLASADAAAERSRHIATGTCLGAAFGALALAFSDTLWAYAGMFTPYILSALFTAIILWTMLRWWHLADMTNAWRWIALLGFEFGLDFSVHRTNALLIPSAIVWVLVREPKTFRSLRAVAGAIAGLTIGLSAQLVLIPIAAHTRSPLDFALPNSLSALWDYMSLKQLGGGFLLGLFPRKAPLAHVQTLDFLRVLGANFLYLPVTAALLGLVWVWRQNARLGVAFTLTLLLQSICTVLYFNIPPNFFRTFDRHYLPVCITIGVLVACGLGVAAEWIVRRVSRRSVTLAFTAACALALVPLRGLITRWKMHDASRLYFAHDYAANVLRTLPPRAIYFTVGDNDTFPVWYVQSVEGLRPDVTIINLSVANVPEWPERIRERDPLLPLSLSLSQRKALTSKRWMDTTLTLPVHAEPSQFDLPAATRLPQSITLDVRPTSGDRMLPAEILLLDIVRNNAWRRPLTFAITGTRGAMEWLGPYGRLDGLYYLVVPIANAASPASLLRANLLRNAEYRGYNDASVPLEDVTRTMGLQAYYSAAALLAVDDSAHAPDQCRADRREFLDRLPASRLSPPMELVEPITAACH